MSSTSYRSQLQPCTLTIPFHFPFHFFVPCFTPVIRDCPVEVYLHSTLICSFSLVDWFVHILASCGFQGLIIACPTVQIRTCIALCFLACMEIIVLSVSLITQASYNNINMWKVFVTLRNPIISSITACVSSGDFQFTLFCTQSGLY